MAPSTAAGDAAPWRFVHPNAKALIGVNWRAMAASPLSATIRKQIPGSQTEGMEFVEQLDRLLLSSPGPASAGQKDAPFLVLLEGRFNLVDLRQRAAEEGARDSAYKLVEVLSPRDASEPSIAILGPHEILLGDRQSVTMAIDRRNALPGNNPLFERAAELAAANEIWAVFATPPRAVSADKFAAMPFTADIESLEGGLSLKEGGVRLRLNAKSPGAAKTLAANVQAMLNLVASRNGAADALRDLDVAIDGASVRLALHVDPRQWAPPAPAVAKAAAPPRPPERQVIRIYGLDEGVREIPFGR